MRAEKRTEQNWLLLKFGIFFILTVGICVFAIHNQPMDDRKLSETEYSEVLEFDSYKDKEAYIIGQMDSLLRDIGSLKSKKGNEQINEKNKVDEKIQIAFHSGNDISVKMLPTLSSLYRLYMVQVLELDGCNEICSKIQASFIKDSLDHVNTMSAKTTEFNELKFQQPRAD